jgi:transcriptional regulator with XRE-family HTH domain
MELLTIGQWIRAAREHKGWTQAQLAKAMSMSAGNISHREKGKHRAAYDQLVQVSRLTGYELHEVAPPPDWPLPYVPFQRLANLSPDELRALQIVMLTVLKAMERSDSFEDFMQALQPSSLTRQSSM